MTVKLYTERRSADRGAKKALEKIPAEFNCTGIETVPHEPENRNDRVQFSAILHFEDITDEQLVAFAEVLEGFETKITKREVSPAEPVEPKKAAIAPRKRIQIDPSTVLRPTGDLSNLRKGVGYWTVEAFEGGKTVAEATTALHVRFTEEPTKGYSSDPDFYVQDWIKYAVKQGGLEIAE